MLRQDTTGLEALRRRLVLLKDDEPKLAPEIELLRDDLRGLARRPPVGLTAAALTGLAESCETALAELRALDDPALASLVKRLELRLALVRARLAALDGVH